MPDGYKGLDPCVHCGFCLPACPTYLATGDENESPRGRIVLMRALERGDLLPTDTDLRHHLDNCLGCLGCEPVCPSGVAYGRGLSTARRTLRDSNPSALIQQVMLAIFAVPQLWRRHAQYTVEQIIQTGHAALPTPRVGETHDVANNRSSAIDTLERFVDHIGAFLQ